MSEIGGLGISLTAAEAVLEEIESHLEGSVSCL